MNPLYHSAFLKALGWSLIDSLWQTGLLWFIYIIITGNGKKFSSSFRYTMALTALFVGTAAFFASILFNYYGPARNLSLFSPSFTVDYIPLLSASYLVLTFFHITRWVYQYTGKQGLLHDLKAPEIDTADLIGQLKYMTSVTRQIEVWCSTNIYTPLTTCFLKPVILIPAAAFIQLSTRQIEALIVHEFFHIKRNDYLINLLTSFAVTVLFFNPFAKILLKDIQNERENCCDDEVIRLGYDRWEYAEALFTLSKKHQQQLQFALSATGNGKHHLLARVKRLLHSRNTGYAIKKPLAIFCFCICAAGSFTEKVNVDVPLHIVENPTEARSDNEESKVILGLSGETVGKEVPRLEQVSLTARVKFERLPTVVVVPKARITHSEPLSLHAAGPNRPAPDEENHAFYVSSNVETIEFSMIEAPLSRASKPDNLDPSQPFVPASTFYFPSHEIPGVIDGKKTIRL